MTWAKRNLNLTIKTVSRTKDTSGFIVLPRRWVVGRSLAWTMNARRHARDYERLVQHTLLTELVSLFLQVSDLHEVRTLSPM